MSWGDKVSETITLASPTDVQRSAAITLQPNEGVHLQWERTDAGVTDSVIISIETTLDDTAEKWDIEPLSSFLVLFADGDVIAFTVVARVYKFRVKIDGDGVADTIVGELSYRKDGIAL